MSADTKLSKTKSLERNGLLKSTSNTEPSTPNDEDFVTADVDEVLKGAREILTKGKARGDAQHPNDRVLDESMVVKVTKTGTIEEPLEVTISLNKIVSRPDEPEEDENDRGWSSDTDLLHARSRLSSTVSHKCSHQKHLRSGSIAEIPTTTGTLSGQSERRHTNVIYRKKRDEFWRRDDQPQKGGHEENKHEKGKEDEAQVQVDYKEECETKQGSHVVTKSWEVRWTVENYHNLPDWLQDNEFLHTGHRPPLPSFVECFKSILSIHTETGNIWTHLIGCLAFFLLALWFLTRPETHIQFQEKLIFSFFFLGAILCLGLSFAFHTVSCHSRTVVMIFSRLDYMGISLLIVGSFIPWIYYGFYCRREPKITYIVMIGVFGLGAIIVSLWSKFNDKRYRPLRAVIFSSMGLSGIVPTIHFIITDGLHRMINENSLYPLLAMAALYLVGAVLYATRTPERFFPGKCDLLFQSHQLFHLCVVCAAFAHYYGISEMAMKRLTGTCPPISSSMKMPHSEL